MLVSKARMRIQMITGSPLEMLFCRALLRSSLMSRRGVAKSDWLRNHQSESMNERNWRLRYRAKPQQVQEQKGKETAVNSNDLRTEYCITKELICGRKSVDSCVKDVKGRKFLHDNKQLKSWKEHVAMISNRIKSREVPPFVEEMISYSNIRVFLDFSVALFLGMASSTWRYYVHQSLLRNQCQKIRLFL